MKKCLRALSCGRGRKKKDKERHDKEGGASSHDTPSAATTPRTTGLALTPLAAPPSPRFRYSPAAAAVAEERQRLLPPSAAPPAPPPQQRQQKQPHPQHPQQQRGRTPSVGPASSAASRVSMGLSPRPATVAVGSLRSASAPRDARSLLAHLPAATAAAPACEPAPQPPLPQGSVPPSHATAQSPAASAAAPSEHLSVRSASARRAACTPDPSPSPVYVDVLDELQRRREREPHRFVNTDANAIVTVGCKGHHTAAPPPPPPSLPKQPSFVPQQNRTEAAAPAVPPPAMASILEQIQRFDTSQLQPVEAAAGASVGQQPHHHHRPAAPVAASPLSPSLSAESPTYGTAPQSAARSRAHSVSLSQSPLGCPSTSLPATSGVAAASTGKEVRRALAPVNPNSLGGGSHAGSAVPHGLRWTRPTPAPPAQPAAATPLPQQTPPSYHAGDAAASAAAAPALLSEAWNGGPQVWREAAALDLSRRSSQGDLTMQLPAQQPAQPQHYQHPYPHQGQTGTRSSPLALDEDDDDEDDERTAEYGTSSSCSAPPFVVGTSVAPAATQATRVEKQADEFEHGHSAPAPSEHEIVAMTLDHGDEYKGTARNGVPHGKGSLRYTNGNSYDGGLRDGLKWGRGMFRWRNGDCYTGEFEGDVFHGHGTFTFAGTTSAYVGLFRDGLFLGDDASAGAASSNSFAAAAAAAPAPQEASASSVRAPAQAPSPAQHAPQYQQQQQRAADSRSPLSERGVYEDRAVVQLNLSAPDADGLAPYWPALPWGSGAVQQQEVIDTQYRSASVSTKGTKAIFATLHQQRHSEVVLA